MTVRHLATWMTIAAAAGALAPKSLADGTYTFTIQSESSALNSSISVNAPTVGTLIGNYDAATNPTGTRTKPGFFGAFGDTENVPDPLELGLVIGGENTTNPEGVFVLELDPEAGTAVLSGLDLDLLGDATPAISITANMRWDTFRTRNPTCTVFGGITIPVPLGQATISQFSLVQAPGEASGTLVPAGESSYLVTVPVTVDATIAAALLDQELPPTPQSVPLVFVATVTLDEQGAASISASLDGFELSQEQAGPIGDPFQTPFTEPLCQGSLIFTLQLQSLAIQSSSDATLVATGVKQAPPACPCDWDGNGSLGTPDFFAFLSSWFAGEPSANFDGLNGVDVPDIFAFLSCWFARPAGCD